MAMNFNRTYVLATILTILAIVRVAPAQHLFLDVDGNLTAEAMGGAVGIFVSGPDITTNCVTPFCNGDMNEGTDGQQYATLLGYSAGAQQNQWLFFNLIGIEGVDVNGVLATNASVLFQREYSIDYGPGTGLAPVTGCVVTCLPEPTTSLSTLAGLVLLGFFHRQQPVRPRRVRRQKK